MLLGLWQDRSSASADVKELALCHVAELEEKILELQDMVSKLRYLADGCSGDHSPDCRIINGHAQDFLPLGASQHARHGSNAGHHRSATRRQGIEGVRKRQ